MKDEELGSLAQQFITGTLPKDLEGFYRGRLLQFFPGNAGETIVGLIAKVWLPWYGKEFDRQRKGGCNLLPPFVEGLLRNRYGQKVLLGKNQQGLRAFPFRTKTMSGLKDSVSVLRLDYDLPENPPSVRNVVDELVSLDKNTCLGKAYMKEKGNTRLIAYFSLEK